MRDRRQGKTSLIRSFAASWSASKSSKPLATFEGLDVATRSGQSLKAVRSFGGSPTVDSAALCPTVGIDVTLVSLGPLGAHSVLVQLWEVPFADLTDGLPSHIDIAFGGVAGIAVVYDCGSSTSFADVDDCRDAIAPYVTVSQPVVMLVGGKDDKRSSWDAAQVTTAALDAYCSASGLTGHRSVTCLGACVHVCSCVPGTLDRKWYHVMWEVGGVYWRV